VTQSVPNDVRYIHMMFDAHELVLSNGYWTESFQPSDHSLRGVEKGQLAELLQLFPELGDPAAQAEYQCARQSLKAYESQILLAGL